MKPSEHLEYFKEHPHIKKKEAERTARVILSNFGTTYSRPAMVQAMDEIDKAISILDMIESDSSKELSELLQGAYQILDYKFHND